jgi:hypothetical protein
METDTSGKLYFTMAGTGGSANASSALLSEVEP